MERAPWMLFRRRQLNSQSHLLPNNERFSHFHFIGCRTVRMYGKVKSRWHFVSGLWHAKLISSQSSQWGEKRIDAEVYYVYVYSILIAFYFFHIPIG